MQCLLMLMASKFECLSLLGLVSICQPNWDLYPLHARLSLPPFPLFTQPIIWIDWTLWLAGGGKLWSSSVRAEKYQYGFNDNIVSQVSAARQGFKQLDIRLTMVASGVLDWFPAG